MRYIGQKSRKVKAVFRRRAEPICGTRQLAGVHRCSQRHPARGALLVALVVVVTTQNPYNGEKK